MDETSSSIGHRSSSLLIGERRRSFVPDEHPGISKNLNTNHNNNNNNNQESWSIRKLLSRRPSEKYRTLERREPRRLRKKSLSVVNV